MPFDNINQNFKKWDARLIWTVTYPSSLFTEETDIQSSFEIYGVDRSSISITRNKTKISSLEQYGQGHIHGIPEIRATILEKEEGPSFELLRRLAASDVYFDLELNLITDGQDNDSPSSDWMDGYEQFIGCTVINERSNYEKAEFPIREFECDVLRHKINAPGADISIGNETIDKTVIGATYEGDGSYRSDSDSFVLGADSPPTP